MEKIRTAGAEDRAVLEKTDIQSFNVPVPKGDALRRELEHFASVVRYGGEFLTPAEREFEALQEMQTILFGNSAKS